MEKNTQFDMRRTTQFSFRVTPLGVKYFHRASLVKITPKGVTLNA